MIEWYLETVTDPDLILKYVLNEFREYFIGRKRGFDIVTTNPLVSRNHAVITLRHDNSLYIKDTNSSNGIWVNDIKIPINSDYLLEKGDLIGIGGPTSIAPERPEVYKLYYRNINKQIEETVEINTNKQTTDPIDKENKINNTSEPVNATNKQIEEKDETNTNKQTAELIDKENKIMNTSESVKATNKQIEEKDETNTSKQTADPIDKENKINNTSEPVKATSPEIKPKITTPEVDDAIEIIDLSVEEEPNINIKIEKETSFSEIKKEPDTNNHSFTQDHDEDIIEINSDDEDIFPRSQLFDDVVKTEPNIQQKNNVETIEVESMLDADADQGHDDSIFGNIKKEEEDCANQIDEDFIDEEDEEDDADEDDCRVWIQKLSQQQDIISCSQEFDRLRKSSQEDEEEEREQEKEEEDHFLQFDDNELELEKSEDEVDKRQTKKLDEEKKKKESKKTYVKPPVIDAPYLIKGKRRATNEEPRIHEIKSKKRKPEEEPPTISSTSSTSNLTVNTTGLVVDKSVREELKKRHKHHRRKSVDSMSRDEKQQIAEERRKKLKEIADKQQEQKKDERPPKSSTKPKVKQSSSRGLFLTDAEIVEAENIIKKHKQKKRHSSTSVDEKSKKKYKIPKVDDKKEEPQNKKEEPKTSKKEEPKNSKKEEPKNKKEEPKNNKKEEPKNKKEEPKNFIKQKTSTSLKPILRNENYIKKPNHVQFNDKIETKIFEREEPQNEPLTLNKNHEPLTLNKNHETSTPTMVNEMLIKILNWLPIWLQEQKKVECCPPNLTERPPLKMFYHFNTAKDYYSIVTPLMLMELWRSIFKDWCNIRNPTILGSVDDLGDVPHMNHNIYMYCHSLTVQGVRDVYINRGDLAIVEIMLNNDRITSNGTVGVATKFGYIKDVQRKRLTKNDRFNENLASKTQIPEYKLTYTILIRRFAERLCDRRLIRVRIVSRIDPPLRLFRSVSFLEKSPLRNFILKPVVKDYKITNPSTMQLAITDNLNAAQLMCVFEACQICTRDEPGIYLIQGPPGTGKSFVIKNIIRQLLYGDKNRKKVRILVCAPSNGAVDEIACRLLDMRSTFGKTERFKMIRLGHPNSITNPLVRNISVPELIRKQMLTEQIHNINSNSLVAEQYNSLLSKINKIEHKVASMKQRKENTCEEEMKLKKAQDDLIRFKSTDRSFQEKRKQERYLEQYYIENADIICSTLSSCMNYRMEELYRENKIKLDCCIIDEATQSNEQENLIPLMLGINKFVLVGDPQQLPPTILSQEAKKLGYGNSLFYRIQHNLEHHQDNPIQMLTEQYRMHPEICQFPSEQFYGGRLKTSEAVIKKVENTLHPYRLFSFRSKIDTDESDYVNKSEANLVLLLSNIIMRKTKYNIGIITPYSKQKDLLIDLFKNVRVDDVNNPNNGSRVIINTVDGFQGQERDVIIISCCRIKLNCFLSDFQRLNVALTRAKYATYICAHAHLFESDSVWKKIEANAQKRNVLFYLNDLDATQEQYMTSLICQ